MWRVDPRDAARVLREAALAAEATPAMGAPVAAWLCARAEVVARDGLPSGWCKGPAVSGRASYTTIDPVLDVWQLERRRREGWPRPENAHIHIQPDQRCGVGWEALRFSIAAVAACDHKNHRAVIARAPTEVECCEAADRVELAELRAVGLPVPGELTYLLGEGA